MAFYSLSFLILCCFINVVDSSMQVQQLLRKTLGALETSDGKNCMNGTTLCWQSCNKIPSPIEVNVIEITPYPIRINDQINIYAEINVTREVGTTPIEIELNLQMKIDGVYEDICYFVRESSCYISDVCQYISCPKQKVSQDTINNMLYDEENWGYYKRMIPFPHPNLPLTITGDFSLIAVARENGRDLGCIHLWFSVANDPE